MNPFETDSLVYLSFGAVIPDVMVNGRVSVDKIGTEGFDKFVSSRLVEILLFHAPLKRQSLKTFTPFSPVFLPFDE